MVNRVIHGSRVTAGTDALGILEDARADFPRTAEGEEGRKDGERPRGFVAACRAKERRSRDSVFYDL